MTMKFDPQIWIPFLGQLGVSVLSAQGKTEQAGLVSDALAAAQAGKNVDDILRKKAEDWATNGEPSVEQLVEARKEIQSSIG
jgi:hypothetical protein